MWLVVVYVPLLLAVTQVDTTEQFVIINETQNRVVYAIRTPPQNQINQIQPNVIRLNVITQMKNIRIMRRFFFHHSNTYV